MQNYVVKIPPENSSQFRLKIRSVAEMRLIISFPRSNYQVMS